jgi:putative hydrolase of the HAD superfamily
VAALKALTFDLWQTLLLDSTLNLRKARELRIQGLLEGLRALGHRVKPEAVEAAYDACGDRMAEAWATNQEVGAPRQVALILESLHASLPAKVGPPGLARLEQAYAGVVLEAMPALNTGAKVALSWAKSNALKVALISNTGRTPGTALRRVLDHFGVARYFDRLSFSDEVGVRKPHPEIFTRTLAALGVPAEAALHVGDDAVADVGGAKGVGMMAIHLRRAADADPPVPPDATIFTLQDVPRLVEPLLTA